MLSFKEEGVPHELPFINHYQFPAGMRHCELGWEKLI
jgi:hypothetical protein